MHETEKACECVIKYEKIIVKILFAPLKQLRNVILLNFFIGYIKINEIITINSISVQTKNLHLLSAMNHLTFIGGKRKERPPFR